MFNNANDYPSCLAGSTQLQTFSGQDQLNIKKIIYIIQVKTKQFFDLKNQAIDIQHLTTLYSKRNQLGHKKIYNVIFL